MTMATSGGGADEDTGSSTRHAAAAAGFPRASTPGTTTGGATVAATAAAEARQEAVNAVANLPMADSSYDEVKLIGNGAYGTVYLGRDRTNPNRLVALKKIRITLVEDGVPVSALREIALLKQLEKFEHPNIVRLLDICHGRIERDSRLTLILVFEYVEQDLDSYLKKCPDPGLEPARIKSLMHQVLCGVDFLHTNRIIHRDLKPQNLLVDKYNRVKIADFGLAKIYDFHMRLTTMVVTLWYRAPEVLLSNSYATPVDIWSCGCIFAELFRRRPVFEGQTEGEQLQRIFDVIGKPRESEWPKDVSLSLNHFRERNSKSIEEIVPEITSEAADLLRKLLRFVPGSRISASEALRHPYFRGLTPPHVTASSNRSNPTQQILSGPQNLSPLNERQISTITNTISSTSLSCASSPTTTPASSITSQAIHLECTGQLDYAGGPLDYDLECTSQTSTNDENDPNTGNSTNNANPTNEPKLSSRSDSTSPSNVSIRPNSKGNPASLS